MAPKNKKIKKLHVARQKTPKGFSPRTVPLQKSIFQQARDLHKAGRFNQAESLYRQILLSEPNQSDALHFLGILAYQTGRGEIAFDLINRAIASRPDYVDAFNNLGIILNELGRKDEAVACLHRALTLKPDSPELHYNMGNILKDQGKLEEAAASYHWALSLNPNHAQAYNNLGTVLKGQGKPEEASAAFARAAALNPHYEDAHYNLGVVLKEQNRLAEAVDSFQKTITLNPHYVDAHYNLGIVLKDQRKLDAAASSFRRAIALNPEYEDAYYNLGLVFKEQGKIEDAAASFRRTVTLKPDFASAHYFLGITLNYLGRQTEAVDCFRQALAIMPDYAEAHYNLGCILMELGQMADAAASLRAALALKPGFVGAYAALSTILKFTEINDDILAMTDIYKNKENLSEAERIDLGFALGKVFEDLKDYDKAFTYLSEADQLKRRTLNYTIQYDRELFEKIKRTFNTDFFTAHLDCGVPDKTPIFVLGMPRSGTTLVEQIIASHPLVFGAGETAVLEDLVHDLCNGSVHPPFPECISRLDRDTLARMGSDYIEKIRQLSSEAVYITDKMLYNFLYIGLIRTILPGAKVIHCRRNPMDNCFAIFKKDFSGAHEYAYDLTELGQFYNLYQDLMAHWDKVLPNFVYTVSYEDLVSDQRKQTKNLLDFCSLPWDDACLTFYKKERIITTASFAQVRQPLYRDSVELWRRYEKYLEPLKKALHV